MPRCARYALLLSLAAPAAAFAQSPPPALAANRVAYVSARRAFLASNDGKSAEARLSAIEVETAKEVAARQTNLQELQARLAQTMPALGEAARRQREQDIGKFELDLKRFIEDAQARFLGARRNVEQAFLAKFIPAVGSLAKERKLLFVLDEDAAPIVWADPALDITADVVKRVDAP